MKALGPPESPWVVFLLVFLLILSIGAVFSQGKVYLDINDPDLVPFPIAIADFTSPRRTNQEIARNIQQVLSNDLMLSGLFRVIESKDFPSKAKKEGILLDLSDLEAWEGTGVDAVLTGSFGIVGNSLTGNFRLYDLVEKKFMRGLRYDGETKDFRHIAHRIANEVVAQITGEKGIFDTKIAFVSNRTGNKEIYLIDFDGENVTQITHNGSINILPCWRPDGGKLYYTSYMKRNPDLYAIDLSSQKNYRVSYRPGINASPAWSPDGEKMVLMLKYNNRSHLFLMKVGAKKSVRLTSGTANYTSPSWSPDGRWITFVSDRSGTPQIYKMDVERKKMERLTYHGSYNVSPVWSPKGDWIAFCSRQNRFSEIFLITPEGKQLRQLTYGAYNNEEPSWSPAGRYLAFSSMRGGKSAIYIMNVNGTHQRKLTDFQGETMNPAWSPYLE